MSLAEVIFASALVGIVIVTMIGTLTGGLEALQKSSNYNQASIVAQRTIELYKSIDIDTLGNADANSIWQEDGFDVTARLVYGQIPPNKLMKLTVIVTNIKYTSLKKSATVEMETMLIKEP
jgi:hypothetical protein